MYCPCLDLACFRLSAVAPHTHGYDSQMGRASQNFAAITKFLSQKLRIFANQAFHEILCRKNLYGNATVTGRGQLRVLHNALVSLLECKAILQCWRDSGDLGLLNSFVVQLQNILRQCVTLAAKKRYCSSLKW